MKVSKCVFEPCKTSEIVEIQHESYFNDQMSHSSTIFYKFQYVFVSILVSVIPFYVYFT